MAFESSEHIDAFKQLIREVPDVKKTVIDALRHPNPQQHFGLKIGYASPTRRFVSSIMTPIISATEYQTCFTSVQYAVMHLSVNQNLSLTVLSLLLKR